MDRSIFDADRDRYHRSDLADRTASLVFHCLLLN